MSTASVAGVPVAAARLHVPAWGMWWLDVTLAEPVVLSGRVAIDFAGIAASGTILSGGVDHERAAYRIIAGAGGWGRTIPEKGYLDDAGVKTATVLRDAAAEAGEEIAGLTTRRIGSHYARHAGPASDVLNTLVPRGWYIDYAGVTQIGTWPEEVYTGGAPQLRVDSAVGVVEFAVPDDGAADFVPGMVIDGREPATDIEFMLESKSFTAAVYTGARLSRRLLAFERLLNALDPRRRYRASYDYRVVTQSGERLNLQPARASSGMPSLANVPIRPGMAGLRANVALGSIVLVAFADGDPSRPGVVNHEEQGGPGWMPLILELGEGPTQGIVRLGDPVVAGPYAGTTTGASARIKAGT